MEDKPIACELPELVANQTRQRIQVFPAAGEYVHPRTGPFTLTKDTLEEFAADLNARGSDIPIDRDHAFYKGMSAPAAGWFVSDTAEVSDSGVTAEVEWTPDGADDVVNRRYRFISPEFAFGHAKQDGTRVPEPRVMASTITNRPFFKTMDPIAAEDLDLGDELLVAEVFGSDVADTLTEIAADAATALIAAAASKSPYGNVAYADPGYRKDGKKRYPIDTEEHVRAAWSYINQKRNAAAYQADELSRIKARIKRAAKKFGVTIGADATTGGSDMDLTALAEAAGLAADASEDDVLKAFEKIAAERDELKTKVAALPGDEAFKALIASAEKGEKAHAKFESLRKETTIAKAVDDLKIAAAEKPHYELLWDIDPDGVEKLLAEKSPLLSRHGFGSERSVKVGDGEITADLSPVSIDGVPTPVVEDTAKVHAAAEALLKQRNVTDPTADQYVAACVEAAGTLGISLDWAPAA